MNLHSDIRLNEDSAGDFSFIPYRYTYKSFLKITVVKQIDLS